MIELQTQPIGSVYLGIVPGEVRLYGSEYGFGIADSVVNLATAGVGSHALAYQFGEFLALAAH